jgi:hypothetical protein
MALGQTHNEAARLEKLRAAFGADLNFIASLIGVADGMIEQHASGDLGLANLPLAKLSRLEDIRARMPDNVAARVFNARDVVAGPQGQTVAELLRAGQLRPLDTAAAIEEALPGVD